MFKLVKIEGSGTNQPEPIRLPVASNVVLKSGCAYIFTNESINNCNSTQKPTHIAIESAKAGEKSEALFFRILENMIFEVPVYGNPNSLILNYKFALKVDSDKAVVGIIPDGENGVAMLTDLRGAKKDGDFVKVRVTTETMI